MRVVVFFYVFYFFLFSLGVWNEYALFVSLCRFVALWRSRLLWPRLILLDKIVLFLLCECVCVCANAIGNKGAHNARLTYLNMPFDTPPSISPLHCLPCGSPMRKNVWYFFSVYFWYFCHCQRRANKLIYYYFTLCCRCCCLIFCMYNVSYAWYDLNWNLLQQTHA